MQFSTYDLQDRNNGNGSGAQPDKPAAPAKSTENGNGSNASAPAFSGAGEPRGSAWQGAAPEMVRDKLQQPRKELRWETEGLTSKVAVALVQGDKKAARYISVPLHLRNVLVSSHHYCAQSLSI